MKINECSVSESELEKVNLNGGGLNGLFLNIRCLNVEGKIDSLKSIVDACNGIDIICLVEAWLKEPDTVDYKLPGYMDHHVTRNSKRGGWHSGIL